MSSTYSSTRPVDPVLPTTLPLAAVKRLSWGAIVAGMVIAVVVQLVLSLLGAGIGLSTIDPLAYSSPDASSFGLGAGIWWIVSSVIALFAGGWVAGHLSGASIRTDAVLHGVLTWGLATIVSVYLIASLVGSVVRGGANVVGKAAGLAATGAAAAAAPAADKIREEMAASGFSLERLKSQAQTLLAQTGKPELQPGAIANQASAAAGQLATGAGNAGAAGNAPIDDLQGTLQRIVASGKGTVEQVDREAVINVVVARTGLSRPEAEQRADAWFKQYQDARTQFEQQKAQAEAKARQVADAAAESTSKAALGAVAALVLGAIAAALGGLTGRRESVHVALQRHDRAA